MKVNRASPTHKRKVAKVSQRYTDGRLATDQSRTRRLSVLSSPRQKKEGENIFSSNVDASDFQNGQFYIESKRVAQVNDILINCFQLEEEKLLFVMKSKVLISNQYLSMLNEIKQDAFFFNIRCFTTSFNCESTEFIQGVLISNQMLKTKTLVKQPVDPEENQQGPDVMQSLVLRMTFISKRNQLTCLPCD